MEDQLLQELANFTEGWIKDQLRNRKFERPNKIGGIINPSPRRLQGTGRLEQSVEVRVDDGDILVIMEDYGADILFGEGRRAGAKQPPSDKIRQWARIAIPGFVNLQESQQKGIAFVIARNIGQRGIGALNLFNLYDEEVFNEFQTVINELLERDDFAALGLDVEELLDRIILLSNNNLELTIE